MPLKMSRKLIVQSSITARDFYIKTGYGRENNGDGFSRKGNTYTLAKWLI